MPAPNFANRPLYHGDNLGFLRGMNSETIDLIATDLPFSTGSSRYGAAGSYEDSWKWLKAGQPKPEQRQWETVVHEDWLKEIRGDNAALYGVIRTARKTHSDGAAAQPSQLRPDESGPNQSVRRAALGLRFRCPRY